MPLELSAHRHPSGRGGLGSSRGPLSESTTNNNNTAGSRMPSMNGGTNALRKASAMASKSKGSSSSSFDMEDEEDVAPRRPSNRPRVSLNGSRAASSAQQRSSSRPDPSSSSDAPHSSSSSRQASSSHTNRSGMSTLARANARRVSMAPAGGLAAVPAPAQKLNVDSTSFEEWMKM